MSVDHPTTSKVARPWWQHDPEWEDQKRRLWAMSPDERIVAMRTGRLSLRLMFHWAAHASDEIPTLNGEWEFIATLTPEIREFGAVSMSAREGETR